MATFKLRTIAVAVGLLMGSVGNGYAISFKIPNLIDTGPNHGRFVAAADLDGANQIDLVVSNYEDNTVSIMLSDGAGGYTSTILATAQGVGVGPFAISIGDVNGGLDDIVVANFGTDAIASATVSVFLNDNSGAFTAAGNSPFIVGGTANARPHGVELADVVGDANLDIITANTTEDNISILTGNGAGDFSVPSNHSVGTTPYDVLAVNLDGDADVDLIVPNRGSNNLTLLRNDGAGVFTQFAGSPLLVGAGAGPRAVQAGDLGGDANLDLAVSAADNDKVYVFTGDGTGAFSAMGGSPFSVGNEPNNLDVGDLDGANKLDIVVTNDGGDSISVLISDGTGFDRRDYYPTQAYPATPGWMFGRAYTPVITDLTGDGIQDVVNANTIDQNISIFEQVITVGNPPVAVADGYTTATDAVLVVPDATGVLSNDTSPDGAYLFADKLDWRNSASDLTPATGAASSIHETGGFTYTPQVGFNGVDVISYRIHDGTQSGNRVDVTILVGNQTPVISGVPATTAEVGVAYSFTPGVTDPDVGDAHTYSIASMPSWASFNPATGELSGTPGIGDIGTDSNIVITVSDDGTPVESDSLASFNIVTSMGANTPPVLSGSPATSLTAGEAYSFTPTMIDPDGADSHTFSIANKPSWLTFDPADGGLTGTPGAGDVATTSGIIITVTDDGTPNKSGSLAAFNLTVNANQVPTISGSPETSVTAGNAYSFVPTANDADGGDVLTFSITNKPSWATFNTATGELSGALVPADVGTTTGVVITVTDDGTPNEAASLAAFNLVVAANQAPTISGTPDTAVTSGMAYSFTPTASDADVGDVLTFSIANMPSWAAFDVNTGALTGTPGVGEIGTTAGVVITVTDDGAPNEATSLASFDLTVAANQAPSISGAPTTSVVAGNAYSFTPTASDPDAADTLTFSIANAPSWAAFDTNTGALTGTPGAGDVATTTGIVITVTDNGTPNESGSLASFDLVVIPNQVPTISGTPTTTVTATNAYSFTPTASDGDAGDTLTFSITNKPSWAAFNPVTGVLTGTPVVVDVGTTAGVVITVTDDGTPNASASLAAFDLTVAPNQAPTISGTPATHATETIAYSFTPTASDSDAGDSLTFSINTVPTWANFNAATGQLSGTPAPADVGSTTSGIVITVTDDGSPNESASLTAFDLIVTSFNDSNGDGLSDTDAAALGLDPTLPSGDTDGDGTSDGAEVGGVPNTPNDSDNDGVIDALETLAGAGADNLVFVVPAPTASSLSLSDLSGKTVSITAAGGAALMSIANGATGLPVYSESDIASDADYNYPFGLYTFNVAAPGGTATVVLTLPNDVTIPANAVVRKRTVSGAWAIFNDATIDAAARTVTLNLTDNDGVFDLNPAPGLIGDPVGLGVPVSTPSSGSGGGCVLTPTTQGGKIDPTLWILAGLSLVFVRRTRKWNAS